MSIQTFPLHHGASAHQVCLAVVDKTSSADFLTTAERERYSGFKFAAKKDAFLLGRLAAKRALGALLAEADLGRIGIRSGIYGQPLVDHPRSGIAEVTVSHSHGLAVGLAYPPLYPMGIDLETVSAVSAAAVLDQLQASAAERTWMASAGLDDATTCCVLWTAREALGKALKTGLNSPLGILALTDLRPVAEGNWAGRYLNFPQSRCLSLIRGDRVLSLAMPGAVELEFNPGNLAARD